MNVKYHFSIIVYSHLNFKKKEKRRTIYDSSLFIILCQYTLLSLLCLEGLLSKNIIVRIKITHNNRACSRFSAN